MIQNMFRQVMMDMMPKIIPNLMAQFWTNVANGNEPLASNLFNEDQMKNLFNSEPLTQSIYQ